MIAAEDAELAERDPALPGLATLLDEEAFAAVLHSGAPNAAIGAAHARYVRYKPGTSCLVSYDVEVGEAKLHVYARAHPPTDRGKLEPVRLRSRPPGPLGRARVLDAELAVAVYPFGDDRRLGGLTAIADGARRRALLARALPDQPELWGAGLRCLRYKPERRFVAELAADGGARALLKIYADGDFQTASRNAKVFVSRGPLRVARRLGRSRRCRLVAFEWLEGRELTEALAAAQADLDATATAGAALAELHAQHPRRLGRHSPAAEARAVHAAAATVGAVCPGLTERAHRLAAAITVALAAAAPDDVTLHGDFSADQVLVDEGAACLVDLDHAVRGDPRADLGSFAAQLERHELAGKLSAEAAGSARAALLEGYGTRAGGAIGPYTAARLLRLAPEPFRYREEGWTGRVEAILTRAEALLAED